MFLRRASHRTAARLSAATQPQVCALLEPLESRRLLNAGQLDPTFADNALGRSGLITDASADAVTGGGIVVQSTGKVVTLALDLRTGNAVLTRYNTDGSLDATFGSGGRAVAPFTGGKSDLALGAGDKLIVGGDNNVGRFNANGSLDTSFNGGAGFITLPAPVTAISLQPDGKVVTAGSWARPSGNTDAEFQRLNADGTVDTTFGSGGIVDLPLAGINRTVTDVAVETNGRIAASGSAFDTTATPTNATRPFVTEVGPNGEFEGDAPFNTYPVGPTATFSAVAATPDGGVVVVGRNTSPSALNGQSSYDTYGLVARFNSTTGPNAGQVAFVDNLNAGIGVPYSDQSPGGIRQPLFNRVAIEPDGKILAAGSSNPVLRNVYAVRLDGAGNLDTTFGNYGAFFDNPEGSTTPTVVGIAFTPDGRARLAIDDHYNGGGNTPAHGQFDVIGLTNDAGLTPGTAYYYRVYAVDLNLPSSIAGPLAVRTATNSRGPYGGTPWAVGTRIEAENYDTGGEGPAYHDTDATNDGGQYRPAEGVDIEGSPDLVVAGHGSEYDVGWTHAGEWLNYTGNFANCGNGGGTYDLYVRAANAGSGGSFHVNVDGVNVTGTLAIPDTGGFQTYTNVIKNGIPITAGRRVVQIVFDGQAASGFSGNLNWFRFVPETTTGYTGTPYGGTPASLPGFVQGENYDSGGQGVAYQDSDPQSNLGGAYRPNEGVDVETIPGGGYAVDYTHAGEWLKYTVNVAATSNYTLDATVSNDSNGGAFHIEVDGVDVTGTLAVPDTGSWRAYQDVQESGISMTAGRHVIRFVWDANNPSGFSGNLDSFRFT